MMLKTVILIFAFLNLSAKLLALCFRINEQVRSNYSQSEAVFVAKVVSSRRWDMDMPVRDGDETCKNDEDGVIFYKVHLKEAIKGNLPVEFEVKTENNSGRVPLIEGETYLLFADRWLIKGRGKSKHYWLNGYGCGDPEDYSLPKAKDKLMEAKEAKIAAERHELAKVGVRVLAYGDDYQKPIAGKHFILTGKRIIKRGTTAKDGWLWFEIPAGHYTVESKDEGVGELVFSDKSFSFDLNEGGGWDCVFVERVSK
jgi:hypothetical protein